MTENVCPTCGNHRIYPESRLPKSQRIPPLPFDDLQVGQGCIVTVKTKNDEAAIRQRIWRYNKKNPKPVFSLRRIDDKTMKLMRMRDDSRPVDPYEGMTELPPWESFLEEDFDVGRD